MARLDDIFAKAAARGGAAQPSDWERTITATCPACGAPQGEVCVFACAHCGAPLYGPPCAGCGATDAADEHGRCARCGRPREQP
jgi:hypothetical protein